MLVEGLIGVLWRDCKNVSHGLAGDLGGGGSAHLHLLPRRVAPFASHRQPRTGRANACCLSKHDGLSAAAGRSAWTRATAFAAPRFSSDWPGRRRPHATRKRRHLLLLDSGAVDGRSVDGDCGESRGVLHRLPDHLEAAPSAPPQTRSPSAFPD